MISTAGITLAPQKTSFSNELTFTLYFPAIPLNATKMDLIENETSDWKFYGISLSNQVSNENFASTKRDAEAGDTDAQFNLGISYFNGQGVSQDYSQAISWIKKAAERGNADAQVGLAGCYYSGNGVSQDYSLAVYWLTKAAEQGNAGAQTWLGVCYEDGVGVTKSKVESIKWYTKAAEQGYQPAKDALARLK